MMERLKRIVTTGVAFALCACLCLALRTQVQAQQTSNIDVTLGTTDNARSGDTVTARILLGNNPGISTFAVRLAYDSNALSYTGATWADSVEENSSNVQLISEVTEDGGQVLNISSILGSTYTNNETIVTLRFTARQDYTTMPVTLTNREITDSSYAPVTANIVVDASAGLTNDDREDNDSEDGDSEDDNSEDDDSEDGDSEDDNSEGAGDDDSEDSESGTNPDSDRDNSSNTDKDKDTDKAGKLDKTPKTGATDIRFLLGSVIVVFLVVAGICIRVLGKKRF